MNNKLDFKTEIGVRASVFPIYRAFSHLGIPEHELKALANATCPFVLDVSNAVLPFGTMFHDEVTDIAQHTVSFDSVALAGPPPQTGVYITEEVERTIIRLSHVLSEYEYIVVWGDANELALVKCEDLRKLIARIAAVDALSGLTGSFRSIHPRESIDEETGEYADAPFRAIMDYVSDSFKLEHGEAHAAVSRVHYKIPEFKEALGYFYHEDTLSSFVKVRFGGGEVILRAYDGTLNNTPFHTTGDSIISFVGSKLSLDPVSVIKASTTCFSPLFSHLFV